MSSSKVRTLLAWPGSKRLARCASLFPPKAASRSSACLLTLSPEQQQHQQERQHQQRRRYASLAWAQWTPQRRNCQRRAPVVQCKARNRQFPMNSGMHDGACVVETAVGGGGCRMFSSSSISSSPLSSFEEDCEAIEECNVLLSSRLDIPELEVRLAELNALVSDPKLYDDSARAGKVVKERAKVESKLEAVKSLTSELQSWREMHDLASLEEEEELLTECIEKVRALRKQAERARTETLLSLGGDSASSNCYLELQAGAGGTESHDWTDMLFKMYTRWAKARGFTLRLLNASPGDEAGLRSVMAFVEGESAYGWLRPEAGVHRLVRNSPYDPTGRRHTSFSQVRIFPEADSGSGAAAAVEIPAKDLKVDTMRAQGAGGQHVNTTDSAVRLTHLPTGLVALSQSDRSQHKNRETAMRALRAKIFQQEEDKRHAKRNEYAQGLGDNAFGNQIRSYVLSPYQMVKDHRTGKQEGDVFGVLDGELNGFIDAALMAEHSEGTEKRR
ncbi:unnamed protein product [Pylaiella littoralis]